MLAVGASTNFLAAQPDVEEEEREEMVAGKKFLDYGALLVEITSLQDPHFSL